MHVLVFLCGAPDMKCTLCDCYLSPPPSLSLSLSLSLSVGRISNPWNGPFFLSLSSGGHWKSSPLSIPRSAVDVTFAWFSSAQSGSSGERARCRVWSSNVASILAWNLRASCFDGRSYSYEAAPNSRVFNIASLTRKTCKHVRQIRIRDGARESDIRGSSLSKYPSRMMRFRTFSAQARVLRELSVRVKGHWRPITRSVVAHSPGMSRSNLSKFYFWILFSIVVSIVSIENSPVKERAWIES